MTLKNIIKLITMKQVLIFSLIVFLFSNCGKNALNQKNLDNTVTIPDTLLSLLQMKAGFYDSLFNSKNSIRKTIEDNAAKEIVQYRIRKADNSLDFKTERSVFFKFSDLPSILSGNSVNDFWKGGLRIYLGKYNILNKAVQDYLKNNGISNFENFKDKQTVIVQFMDENNGNYKYLIDKTDLANYNLGELCPPCLVSNSSTGQNDDEYTKK